tara:strand:+ start:406 stop:567 length:162 start_codon:yes stop_codon:yes gene_type:complete
MVALTKAEKKQIIPAYNKEVPKEKRTIQYYLTFKKYAIDNPDEFRELLKSYGT